MTVISLYDTYGPSSVNYILNQGEIETVFVDSFKRMANITKIIDELPHLRIIVHFDEFTTAELESLSNLPKRLEIISFTDLMVNKLFEVN
jgi:hypothetical protein